MLKTAAVALSLFLTACSFTPTATSDAVPAPREQVMAPELLLEWREGTSEVVIKRDNIGSGRFCPLRVYANGVPIADLRIGEKVTVFLPDGDHILGAEKRGICSGNGIVEITAGVSATKANVFRYGPAGNGVGMLMPTAF